MTKTFYAVLANTLAASLTNNSVWFAVTFWAYLETKSVLVTAAMAGVYLTAVAVSGFLLGTLVDHYRKKAVMLLSSACSLALYVIAGALYTATPPATFNDPASPVLWAFITLALFGAIAGNVRAIALSTLVTLLVPVEKRGKANGLVGTSNGVSFLVASIASGLVVGFLGVLWMLALAVAATALVVVHLLATAIPESEPEGADGRAAGEARAPGGTRANGLDIRGTLRAVGLVPGLFALIFFSTFNNFLGGVFMALMDAYGLSLVSVQVWGALWGFLSLGFIVGGLIVSRTGLGRNPLRTLLLSNVVMWTICALFTLHASVVLLTSGLFVLLCLVPVAEAAEQTIMQKVIPYERQGRVFGFAQSVEQAASPLTAFLIGPVAQFLFVPFMTTGRGADLIGGWFGTGADRGIALLFTMVGIVGLLVTLAAMRSRAYERLSGHYARPEGAAARHEQEVTP